MTLCYRFFTYTKVKNDFKYCTYLNETKPNFEKNVAKEIQQSNYLSYKKTKRWLNGKLSSK